MTRSRKLATWWLALMAALAVVGLTVPAVQAAPSEASHWTATRSDARPVRPVTSISCPTQKSCTALGGHDAALTYDGRTWKGPRDPDGERSAVSSVSCPTKTFCAAVGGLSAVVERGRHWGKVKAVSDLLYSVSCASTRFCLAVGRGGHTLRFDGRRWHPGPRAPKGLWSVSCVSATFCMAGEYTTSATHMYRFTGHSWRGEGTVPMAFNEQNGAVSCASRTLCVAAGLRQGRPPVERPSLDPAPLLMEPRGQRLRLVHPRLL